MSQPRLKPITARARVHNRNHTTAEAGAQSMLHYTSMQKAPVLLPSMRHNRCGLHGEAKDPRSWGDHLHQQKIFKRRWQTQNPSRLESRSAIFGSPIQSYSEQVATIHDRHNVYIRNPLNFTQMRPLSRMEDRSFRQTRCDVNHLSLVCKRIPVIWGYL